VKLLADSDFWYGLVVAGDGHHAESKKLLKKVLSKDDSLYCLRLVVYETATVLSRRIDQRRAIEFLERFRKLPVTLIDIDIILEDSAWEIFLKQTKKGTSFIDCANLATLEKYKLDGILSFDEFYPKEVAVRA